MLGIGRCEQEVHSNETFPSVNFIQNKTSHKCNILTPPVSIDLKGIEKQEWVKKGINNLSQEKA